MTKDKKTPSGNAPSAAKQTEPAQTTETNSPATDISRVAGGAGLAILGRLGALIEAVSVVVFTWAYGPATFGLFAVLWSYVKVSTALSDAAMTTALQRFVPRVGVEHEACVTGYAIKLSFLLACAIALVVTWYAPMLSDFFSVAKDDRAHLTSVIRVYIWVLPFWTLVEVATAAIRARRKFGPEIRVRIFYEQGLRLIAAVAFFYLGLDTYGLFLAHLLSVLLAAMLAFRLLCKHYALKDLIFAPMTGKLPREMRQYGFSVMPSNIIKKLFSEFPVMLLNYMLPGAAGAAAGGYYAVARKIASTLQVVRLAFEYVMAPMAAEKAGQKDRSNLKHMYAFATRLSICLALPAGAALYLMRADILSALEPGFQAAASAITILVAGRVLEAASGPSTAIIEMLGHRMAPPINGLIGMVVFITIGWYAIPAYQVTGAALAAAAGLNVTAYLAFWQSAAGFKLFPYNRDILKPLLVSTISALALVLASTTVAPMMPAPMSLILAVIGLVLALFALVRFGLNADDAAALGKPVRWLRRKIPVVNAAP